MVPGAGSPSRHARWHRLALVAALACGALLAVSTPTLAQRQLPEAEIRAAFILKFPAFLTWSHPLGDTLRIGVVDGEELLAALDRLAAQHNAQPEGGLLPGVPRVVHVEAVSSSGDPTPLDILVLAGTATGGAPDLIERAHRAGVLTIDSRLESGRDTVIILSRESTKICFDINLAAARAAAIKISSRLLQLAHGHQGIILVREDRARLC